MLVFCFSVFHFNDFLTTFASFSWQISKVLILPTFSKIWHLEIFDNETTVFFKKWKNYTFWHLILTNLGIKKFWNYEFVKYGQRYFDSERLWYSKLFLLKLPAIKLAILHLKSLWKSIKLWEVLISVMKTDGFSKIFGKSSSKSSK